MIILIRRFLCVSVVTITRGSTTRSMTAPTVRRLQPDRFVAAGAGRDHADGCAEIVGKELKIVLRDGWKFGPLFDSRERLLPAADVLIHRLDLGEDCRVRGELLQNAALVLIVDAEGNLVKGIEHVDLRDHDRIEGVDHCRVPCRRAIEPSTTPRPPGGGSIFIPPVSQLLARSIERLCRKWAGPDASGVSLRDAGYRMHILGRDPETRRHAAGSCAGRRDERKRPVVHIQECALSAFEKYGFA